MESLGPCTRQRREGRASRGAALAAWDGLLDFTLGAWHVLRKMSEHLDKKLLLLVLMAVA